MDLLVLDRSYTVLDIIDTYESLIWTERYCEAGEFELYCALANAPQSLMTLENYVYLRGESDRLMIIEKVSIDTDAEDGIHLTVTGRSLESILERRVVWNETNLSGDFQHAIYRLLYENVMEGAALKRVIPLFTFQFSSDTGIVNADDVDNQYTGETVYEAIQGLCEERGVGFRVLPNWDTAGGFIFSLYKGTDHSYAQDVNPWVVFSANYENLLSSNYYESSEEAHTAALGTGTWNDEPLYFEDETDSTATGLDRRETTISSTEDDGYVSALDENNYGYYSGICPKCGTVSRLTGPDAPYTIYYDDEGYVVCGSCGWTNKGQAYERLTLEWTLDEDAYNAAVEEEDNAAKAIYLRQIQSQAHQQLSKETVTAAFEGEVDATQQFVYREDFDIGDVAQIVTEYGIEATVRVTEIVLTHDESGLTMVPTFESVGM